MKSPVFVCESCQEPYARWQGQCNQCLEWNSIQESITHTKKPPDLSPPPTPITNIAIDMPLLYTQTLPELDHVLGNGLVMGATTLLGGEPGIGKSTLAMQLAKVVTDKNQSVLYISAEESATQLALRAKRLNCLSEKLTVYTTQSMGNIVEHIQNQKPHVVILDSIQVVKDSDLSGVPGSVSQVHHCANRLVSVTKTIGCHSVIIGHITKEGGLAGPKVLEHLVDIILFFEGDRYQSQRILRCFKNRYGSTEEIGLFTMEKTGLVANRHPEKSFLDRPLKPNQSGSMIVPIQEGSRVFLIEIQALVVSSGYGMAKRTFVGVDQNRINVLIATLEKNLSIKLSNKDIFVTVIGGYKLNQPAADLGILLSILSAFYTLPLSHLLGVVGEVDLTGHIRPVKQLGKYIQELGSLGFQYCITPNQTNTTEHPNLTTLSATTIQDAVQHLLKVSKKNGKVAESG